MQAVLDTAREMMKTLQDAEDPKTAWDGLRRNKGDEVQEAALDLVAEHLTNVFLTSTSANMKKAVHTPPLYPEPVKDLPNMVDAARRALSEGRLGLAKARLNHCKELAESRGLTSPPQPMERVNIELEVAEGRLTLKNLRKVTGYSFETIAKVIGELQTCRSLGEVGELVKFDVHLTPKAFDNYRVAAVFFASRDALIRKGLKAALK